MLPSGWGRDQRATTANSTGHSALSALLALCTIQQPVAAPWCLAEAQNRLRGRKTSVVVAQRHLKLWLFLFWRNDQVSRCTYLSGPRWTYRSDTIQFSWSCAAAAESDQNQELSRPPSALPELKLSRHRPWEWISWGCSPPLWGCSHKVEMSSVINNWLIPPSQVIKQREFFLCSLPCFRQ